MMTVKVTKYDGCYLVELPRIYCQRVLKINANLSDIFFDENDIDWKIVGKKTSVGHSDILYDLERGNETLHLKCKKSEVIRFLKDNNFITSAKEIDWTK